MWAVEREVLVFLDLDGVAAPVGKLWTRARGVRETASFEYERSWVSSPGVFGLDPNLPLAPGTFHTRRPLFNAFTDPAPDRWGETLLRRNERRRARKEGRQPRALRAIDFLLLVDDESRLGALRFQDPETGQFLTSTGRPVPPLVDLPRLLGAASRIIDDEETDEDLRLLLAPATSLGGARPKASVRGEDGHLLIAKFPRRDDDWPVTRWEAASMALAEAARVEVSPWRLQTVSTMAVLTARRFDRHQGRRVPFMSALTALDAADHEMRSYLEIAEFLRRESESVDANLRQLWRRIVFNILISNTDDHLRNHGFLRGRNGWRLSPAFDLNPVPADVKPRVHALAIDEFDETASLDNAFRIVPMFGMAGQDARKIAAEVGEAVGRWREAAARFGITPDEMERMSSAFEHEDLLAAAG